MEREAMQGASLEKQNILQLIIFRIGDEEFGVFIEAVQEIIKAGAITPIPDSPPFIKGLINVRGDIVAIIDVKARFSLVTQTESPKHIVIAKRSDNLFGLMVDEVMEVLRVQESDIKPPPQLMSKIHKDYVHGVITHEGRLIILLNLDQVLSEDELIRMAELTRDEKKEIPLVESEEKEVEKKDMDKPNAANSKNKKSHSKKNKGSSE